MDRKSKIWKDVNEKNEGFNKYGKVGIGTGTACNESTWNDRKNRKIIDTSPFLSVEMEGNDGE